MTTPARTDSSHPFAVITASSGIGLERARVSAEHGHALLVTAESERIDGAASEHRASGARDDTVRADLACYDGVEQLYQAIQSSGRSVDAIAINAGVGSGGPFVETDLERELDLIQLNVSSVVHLAKRVLQDMHARDEGKMLSLSPPLTDRDGIT